MSLPSAGHWVKFFNASGIPSPTAATYAHIFVENRIQNDMLLDLNKEYLREMGIKIMGDIIAILRHAKNVSDQTAREKVLSAELQVPIAAVTPVAPHKTERLLNLKSADTRKPIDSKFSSTVVPIARTEARRVLPEHEGKYKIKFPTGTTERSKDILAKKAKLYSDREYNEKPPIHKRLTCSDNEADVRVRIKGIIEKPTSSASIFARLGGKSIDSETTEQTIKPILKNTSTLQKKSLSTIVKAKDIAIPQKTAVNQKVLMVKRVPLRVESDDNSTDESDDVIMDYDDSLYTNGSGGTEKIVKFAPEAEVHEISATRFNLSTQQKFKFNYRPANKNLNDAANRRDNAIKSRLGIMSKLHTTKKSYNLKPATTKSFKGPIKTNTIVRLKSDEMLLRQNLPVHARLGSNTPSRSTVITTTTTPTATKTTKSAVSKLSQRIGKVNLSASRRPSSSSLQRHSTAAHTSNSAKSQIKKSKSVFDRLGFN